MGTTLQQNCHRMRKQRNERTDTDTRRMSRKEKATIKTEQQQKQKQQQQHTKNEQETHKFQNVAVINKAKANNLILQDTRSLQRLINAIHQYHKISENYRFACTLKRRNQLNS